MRIFNKNPEKDLIVIAEIGVNHQGDVNYAKNLIQLAAEAGADAVKFQSYTARRYASRENMERYERVGRFALNESNHLMLINYAEQCNVHFFSTPVTEDWVPFLNEHTNAFKIASGDITFEPVIRAAAVTGKPLIISTGAATIEEIDQAVSWVKDEIGDEAIKENLALMHCVTSYPAAIETANVRSVPYLAERYGITVGYSNHVIEPEACYAAVALGANIIEVHFTDNKRDRDFHDHTLSFEPQELKDFISVAKRIKSSLGELGKFVQPNENDLIPHVRKGVVASRDLHPGHVITEDDLMYARPATTYKSSERSSLVGKKLLDTVPEGYTFKKENFA